MSHESPEEAEAIVRDAARRALGSRSRWRMLAAVLWAGFLGAPPILLLWIGGHSLAQDTSLGQISAMFFLAWGCATVPALIAAVIVDADLVPSRRHSRDEP